MLCKVIDTSSYIGKKSCVVFVLCLLTAVICCALVSPVVCVCVLYLCILREEEAIQLDGLNAAQIKELREKSEKHAFQAEVNRMMKLIINSLYKNKEVSKN